MRCYDARNLLSEYLDDELSGPQRDTVQHHLAECAACRSEYEELRRTFGIIHSLPRQEPVFELWQEFAPRFAEIHAEMSMGPVRLYFSRLSSAISEGWTIFLNVVRTNARAEIRNA